VRTFIQFTSLFLTLGSAGFVARGSLALTPKAIAQLAVPRWGYHLEVIANLAQQRVDTAVGVFFLLIAFALQMWGVFRTMPDSNSGARTGAILAALATCAVLLGGAWFVANAWTIRTARIATTIAKEIVGETTGDKAPSKQQ